MVGKGGGKEGPQDNDNNENSNGAKSYQKDKKEDEFDEDHSDSKKTGQSSGSVWSTFVSGNPYVRQDPITGYFTYQLSEDGLRQTPSPKPEVPLKPDLGLGKWNPVTVVEKGSQQTGELINDSDSGTSTPTSRNSEQKKRYFSLTLNKAGNYFKF